MQRRYISLTVVVLACLTTPWWSAKPSTARRAPLSIDLEQHKLARPTQRTRVIVQGDLDTLMRLASKHRVRLAKTLDNEGVFELNAAEMDALAAEGVVTNLSGDAPVESSSMTVVNKSTTADKTRAGQSGLLGLIGNIPGVNGTGVGIAVVDSGISPHKALGSRVVANVSFVTGDSSTADKYGHGTHIAGIIAGNGSYAGSVTSEYSGGIAPNANLINVRVLDNEGRGYTSDVIAGINWVIANKSRYNIRVMNVSLGHPVTERASLDPLCLAVKRAYEAGIVVVASAGNRGKDANGTLVLGGITSPGNSPYALTVGALNTWDTVSRSDDSVTTYSSRGPTKEDLAVKPDVVAPGNKIVSLEVSGSTLATDYPEFHVGGSGTNGYARLSGTSMAAGVVSGGVALLVQGNSSMTPARVKFTVQNASNYMVEGGLNAAGAGSVNFWPGRKVSYTNLISTLLNLVTDLLTTSSGASFVDHGTMMQRMYQGNGISLLSILDLPSLLLNPLVLVSDTLNLVGPSNSIGLLGANRTIWGDVSYWTPAQTITWGDNIQDPQGNTITWGDQTTEGDTITWGDSVIEGD